MLPNKYVNKLKNVEYAMGAAISSLIGSIGLLIPFIGGKAATIVGIGISIGIALVILDVRKKK
jgi:hypothetical protein